VMLLSFHSTELYLYMASHGNGYDEAITKAATRAIEFLKRRAQPRMIIVGQVAVHLNWSHLLWRL
jgi:hypothetical protein